MKISKASIIASSIASILLVACASQQTDPGPTAAAVTPPHPDEITGIKWKVGDTCVTEYRFGYKRVVHTAVVTDVTSERTILSDTADDGSSRVIVYEGADGGIVAKKVAVSNGEQIEFAPPMKWLTFPLKPGLTWTDQSVVKGQTFQLNLSTKFEARTWEAITVPAGQFAAVKVTADETYTAGRNRKGESFTGGGTVTYWMAPDSKCPVKWQYKNTFGDKTTMQLLSYKDG